MQITKRREEGPNIYVLLRAKGKTVFRLVRFTATITADNRVFVRRGLVETYPNECEARANIPIGMYFHGPDDGEDMVVGTWTWSRAASEKEKEPAGRSIETKEGEL